MKSVLVTGGTVRIGKAIAEALQRAGWRVLTSSHRADAGADFIADLSDPFNAVKLYAEVLKTLGGNPPDALINNAALFTGDEASVRNVDFESPKKLTMLMAGRETSMGTIINVLDASSDRTDTCAAPAYGAAKRDLRDWTLASAEMFAQTLRVNAISLGPVLPPVGVHEKAVETLLEHRTTLGDVTRAVAFLLAAESTTGAILPV